jgi:hypothetical protein
MSAAANYLRSLGDAVATQLGDDYSFLKTRLTLKRPLPNGTLTLTLSGSNKYSPYIFVAFHFGVAFPEVSSLEKRLGIYQFPMHVQQYSPNCSLRKPTNCIGPCSWEVDITQPPSGLVNEVAVAIEALAMPFYETYGSLLAARNAIASNDPNVFGGPAFWAQLLRLDLALDDLGHFEKWSERLDSPSLAQAAEVVRKHSASTPRAHRDA